MPPTLNATPFASPWARTLHPPGLAGPSCGPSHARGAPTSQRGPPGADRGPPALRPAHPCQRLETAARQAWPVHAPRPGWRAHDIGPFSRAHRPGLGLTHRSGARPPADRQSRRRARSSRSSDERRRTTTPRSLRAPRGTVGSAVAMLRQKRGRLAGRWGYWLAGERSCGGGVIEVWGCRVP